MMDKALNYSKNVAVVLLTGLALFVMTGAVAVVLEALTWEVLGDWTTKAASVAVVLLVGNFVVSMLLAAVASKKSD